MYNQSLTFNGVDQHVEFTAPPNMPSGSDPRTVEFWMRSSGSMGAYQNHEAIIELGEQAHNGSAFGIFTYVAGGYLKLCFWGHNADKANIAVLPDDQWHFVSVTYDEPTLTCYLDGEYTSSNEIITAVGSQRLNTKVGTCYVGAFPSRNWRYQGMIRSLTVWNRARTAEEIAGALSSFPAADMAGFDDPAHPGLFPAAGAMVNAPGLDGTEDGLVLHFDFAEGQGTTTTSKGTAVEATLTTDAMWSTPIADNPTLLSPGIWFAIQNKSDIDEDATPDEAEWDGLWASTDGSSVEMKAIPDIGNYDRWLWRAIADASGTRYRLVNKALGDEHGLVANQQGVSISDAGTATDGDWTIEPVAVNSWGGNVYQLSSDTWTGTKRLALDQDDALRPEDVDASDTGQGWVFQPMSLVQGYDIITEGSPVLPFTKVLTLDKGYTIRASNTVSDWALLNVHNIYANVFHALKDPTAMPKDNTAGVVYVVSRHDALPCKYPGVYDGCDWLNDTRGYGGAATTNKQLITEEMMCKTGVASRGPKDTTRREFDQVVHEFAHTLDSWFFSAENLRATAVAQRQGDLAEEWFPWTMQKWFDSSEPRSSISTDGDTIMRRCFNPLNTWQPPGALRETTAHGLLEQAPRYRFIVPGTLLTEATPILSTGRGTHRLQLESGDLVVTELATGETKWKSSTALTASTTGVTGVYYSPGDSSIQAELVFVSTTDQASAKQAIEDSAGQTTGIIVDRKPLHPAGKASCRLMVNDDPSEGNPAHLAVLDTDGNVLWRSAG